MTIEEWWPRLQPVTREWLVANNGDVLPGDISAEIVRAGGPAELADEDTDWIEAAANGEVPI
jgi:hypothetical protein